jgi:hypothetical protein
MAMHIDQALAILAAQIRLFTGCLCGERRQVSDEATKHPQLKMYCLLGINVTLISLHLERSELSNYPALPEWMKPHVL